MPGMEQKTAYITEVTVVTQIEHIVLRLFNITAGKFLMIIRLKLVINKKDLRNSEVFFSL